MENTASSNPFDRARTGIASDVEERFASGLLTPRKRRMVEAYVRHGTFTAAAEASGYSPATVSKYIHEDAAVRKAIGQLVDQASLVTGVTLERVLQEYARLAFSDMGEFIDVLRAAGQDGDVALEKLAELPADLTAAVSEVAYSSKGGDDPSATLKLKFWDKKGALQDLGRMLSLFNDKLTVDDNTGFGDRLKRAIEKIESMESRDG